MRRFWHWFTGHPWLRFEFSGGSVDEYGGITDPVLRSIVLFCDCGKVVSHAVSQKLASDAEIAELRKIAGLASVPESEPEEAAAARSHVDRGVTPITQSKKHFQRQKDSNR